MERETAFEKAVSLSLVFRLREKQFTHPSAKLWGQGVNIARPLFAGMALYRSYSSVTHSGDTFPHKGRLPASLLLGNRRMKYLALKFYQIPVC